MYYERSTIRAPAHSVTLTVSGVHNIRAKWEVFEEGFPSWRQRRRTRQVEVVVKTLKQVLRESVAPMKAESEGTHTFELGFPSVPHALGQIMSLS